MQGNAFVQWKERPLQSHNRMIRITRYMSLSSYILVPFRLQITLRAEQTRASNPTIVLY